MKPLGGALLSPDDHRELFLTSGYADVQMFLERAKGWIAVTGRSRSYDRRGAVVSTSLAS